MKSPFEMSLGGQFADLDRAYRHCCEDKLTLLGRCAELEELVSEYEALVEDVPDEATDNSAFLAWETRRMDLQQRHKAALHEGKEEHDA